MKVTSDDCGAVCDSCKKDTRYFIALEAGDKRITMCGECALDIASEIESRWVEDDRK